MDVVLTPDEEIINPHTKLIPPKIIQTNDSSQLTLVLCHPAYNPQRDILQFFPECTNIRWMTHWDPELPKFLKKIALPWSKQRTTNRSILVIDDADSISVHGFSSILGLLEQGFARPLVLILSNIQKIPKSLYNRSTVISLSYVPEEHEGWYNENPHLNDHHAWERVLRS